MLVKDKNGKSSLEKIEGRTVIAIMLIAPAFIILGSIVVLHWDFESKTIELIKLASTSDKEQRDFIEKRISEMDRSNQTVYNILIPVFASWVSAVVAFYFGSRQAEAAQKATEATIKEIKSAQGPSDKLSKITVADVLKSDPDKIKDVGKVKITDPINREFEKEIEFYGSLVVQFDVPKEDSNGNYPAWIKSLPEWEKHGVQYYKQFVGDVLGILYMGDLYALDAYNNYKNKPLGELIYGTKDGTEANETLIDAVTDKKWTINPEVRIGNFATLNLTDTLKDAKTKLENVSDNAYDARGIVFDEQGNVQGVISSYDLLANV